MRFRAAINEQRPSHLFALFSGGHDSLAATLLAADEPEFTAVVHVNTGIGIEQTREFVRETCAREGWPLIEMHPDGLTYEELVLRDGFPSGPKSHSTMYYWLKQRQIRRLVREHKVKRGDRIMLVTGIRKAESVRRMRSVMAEPCVRQGAIVWANPILDWTAVDCGRLIAERECERNPVVDLLHRSGECLCGALARSSEILEIERWFPAAATRIHALERRVEDAGHGDCIWAGRQRVNRAQNRLFAVSPLCSSCEAA